MALLDVVTKAGSERAYARPLTSGDRAYLAFTRLNPGEFQDVGALLFIDGPPLELADLRAHVAERLRDPRARMLTDRLETVAVRCSGRRPTANETLWVSGPGMNVDDHVVALDLPSAAGASGADRGVGGVGDARLRAAVDRIAAQPIDISRPPWMLYLLRAPGSSGTVLVYRTSHIQQDGFALYQALHLLFGGGGRTRPRSAPRDPPAAALGLRGFRRPGAALPGSHPCPRRLGRTAGRAGATFLGHHRSGHAARRGSPPRCHGQRRLSRRARRGAADVVPSRMAPGPAAPPRADAHQFPDRRRTERAVELFLGRACPASLRGAGPRPAVGVDRRGDPSHAEGRAGGGGTSPLLHHGDDRLAPHARGRRRLPGPDPEDGPGGEQRPNDARAAGCRGTCGDRAGRHGPTTRRTSASGRRHAGHRRAGRCHVRGQCQRAEPRLAGAAVAGGTRRAQPAGAPTPA